jgi:ADP-heptose:LPS heptosyltransferase
MKPLNPSRILLIKGHSAGIGDILRSSAAWRVLKNKWPNAELHLVFFTREPGYSSEKLIRDHHLLSSCSVIDKRTKTWKEWRRFWKDVRALTAQVRPDLVIDFESSGLRTSLVAMWCAWRWGAKTVGINTAPGRNLFYGRASVSSKTFAAKRGMPWPMDYTERDFVALSALGLERAGCPIELAETEAGTNFRLGLRRRLGLPPDARLLGLNIGCGTPGASNRRPSLPLLSKLIAHLQSTYGLQLVVGIGAPFEHPIDEEFLQIHRQNSDAPVIDLDGKVALSELGGFIKSCSLFVSPDTGPYHMAVALRVPTLAVFNFYQYESEHHHPWVRCVVAKNMDGLPKLIQAADELMQYQMAGSPVAH